MAVRAVASTLSYPAIILLSAVAITFGCEMLLRGSAGDAASFLVDLSRPGLATVALVALALTGLDALMHRRTQSVLVAGPLLLLLAWVGREKLFYLGDPPYPTDFLYARQIGELIPLLVVERPFDAALIAIGALGTAIILVVFWRLSRRMPRMRTLGRIGRLAIAIPAFAWLATHMDYASHSPLRSNLKIAPMMWDQKANYAHNGLVLAFALNLPMANVAVPEGYSPDTLAAIQPEPVPAFVPARQPDIIMVMSESLWDPTRLPGTTLSPDPIAFTRKMQSGHVFSPEFGGMTANVEFEALTGFSNAMLPYGSIPYQQYVRGDLPSLASFLGREGYATLAIHPFQKWFWNRANVYGAFGFDRFISEETMEPLEKRGQLAGDAALTELIIKEAEAAENPLFLFAVTLQNHGPYEKGRYPDQRIKVETRAGDAAATAIHTFSEGMMDSDLGLKRLIDWAAKRERETIVVFFGDHLPPLGPTWVATSFMKGNVSDRFGPPQALTRERETPLIIWSNRKGRIRDVGTVSPSFLPLHTLRAARMQHPFYTGFLGEMHDRWHVVDRHMLVDNEGVAYTGWSRGFGTDPILRDYRLIQYDTMFGDRHVKERFFPSGPSGYGTVRGPLKVPHRPV